MILLISLTCSLSAIGQYWQQEVNFVIEVGLNDKDQTLDGFEKIEYINHSPDTLHFIWFHLWPNAFKNDKTAFSEQLLINGRTDFYFSNKEQRGYINRLDFKINNITVQTEDHPQYIDIIKLVLPQPLAPGAQILITTPFHIQLPENFSRGGHTGDAYQITQWYPKPAVYDPKGWHPMPYLNQGEFYSDFGNYDVRITLPENYVVAATGRLQNEEEKEWLKSRSAFTWQPVITKIITKKGSARYVKKHVQAYPISSERYKTIQFKQEQVHDFAWFADKRFVVKQDTLLSATGSTITASSFYLPENEKYWKNSVTYLKNAVRYRSQLLGAYPYSVISAVDAKMGVNGGMEYPTITSISPVSSENELEATIEHEAGHNWLQGILANNEREYPWMDEGMNTYYDNRYQGIEKKQVFSNRNNFLLKRMPSSIEPLLLETIIGVKKDQPINTAAPDFTEINDWLIAYHKAGAWMKQLENYLGQATFDSGMHAYYLQWKFKHPYPVDFKNIMETSSGKNLDSIFQLLNKTGPLTDMPKRKIKLVSFFNLNKTDKNSYINILPGIGYNQYDQLMLGLIVNNYELPFNKFQFLAAPLYGTGSKTLNGIGRLSYSNYADGNISKLEFYLSGERFSSRAALDTFNKKIFESFYKITPGIRISFKHPLLSHISSNIDARVFIIGVKSFDKYAQPRFDSLNYYPTQIASNTHYITQVSYNFEQHRVLYPYQFQLQLQQGKDFYRFNLNGNYYLNYAKGGGLNLRAFAATFGYIGGKNINAYIYQPKLLGIRNNEDYTYSNYFEGRSASIANGNGPIPNKGLGAQQIMVRDGGLKLSLDQYEYLQGRSESWVGAINLTSTLPFGKLSEKIPLRLFLDMGTYAEAWKPNPSTSKFLYTAGLQLSLLKNVLNIYLPLFYSSDFKNAIKSTWPQNTALNSITFSIDLQRLNLQKLNNHLEF